MRSYFSYYYNTPNREKVKASRRTCVFRVSYIEKIIAIPPKQFDDTAIGTVALVLRKGRKENTITFVNEQGTERTVSFSEIKENITNTIEKIQLLRECMGVIKTFDGTEKVSIAEEYEFEKAAFVEGTWRILN